MGLSQAGELPPANTVASQQVSWNENFEARSKAELVRLYTSLVEIRIIEDYIAQAIAKIPVKVKRGDKVLTNSNELSKVYDQANPTQAFVEVFKEALIYYGVTGNLFLYHQNGYLYALPTQNIEILLALGVNIPEFKNFIAGYMLDQDGIRYPLQEQDVLHMKTPQLESRNGIWAWGSSPYNAAIANIDALEAVYSSRVSMIEDRGALGILSNKSQIPDKEATEKVQEALSNYGVMKGQRRFIATPEDLQWTQMSLNMEELQLLQSAQADFSRLCEVRGIDVNVFSAEDTTYENQYAAVENTYRRAIIPLTQQFYTKLKPFTMRHFGGLYFEPDMEYMPEMADTQTKQSVKVANEVNSGIISPQQALDMLYPTLEYDAKNIEQVPKGPGSARPFKGQEVNGIKPNGEGVVQGGTPRVLNN